MDVNNQADTGVTISDPDVIECPYATYATLREETPVYLDPVTKFYVLTRYDDVRQALLKPDLYLSDAWMETIQDEVQIQRKERANQRFAHEGLGVPGLSIGMLRPERHRPVRAVFDNAFRASRMKDYEPYIREAAFKHMRRFAEQGEGDLVKDFAIPYPLSVISHLVGIPEQDFDRVKQWTYAWIQRFGMMLDDEGDYNAVSMEIDFQHYTKQVMDRLRAEPDGTILSELVNTKTADGEYLSDNDLFTHIQADLLVAGSETTQNTMAAGVLLLCQNPEIDRTVRSDPDKYLRVFIEEVLRVESPVQGLFRVAAEDIELHGVTIPRGSLMQLRYGSANRDPNKFANPECVDLERKDLQHFGFGGGPHRCAGAPLARLELTWAFKAFFELISDVELLPDNDYKHLQSIVHRGLASLKIRFKQQ